MAGRIAVVAKQILAAQTSTSITQDAELEDTYYDSCGNLRQLKTPSDTAKPEQDVYYDLTSEKLLLQAAAARKPEVNEELEDGCYYDSCGNLRQEGAALPQPTNDSVVTQSEEVEDGYYYDSCGNLRQDMGHTAASSHDVEPEPQHGFYYDSCGNLRPEMASTDEPEVGHQEQSAAMSSTEHETGFYYDSCGNMRQEMAADEPRADVAVIRKFAKNSFAHKLEMDNVEPPNGYYYDSCGNLRQEM